MKLTSGASITQTSEQVTQWIQTEPAPIACSALRVKDDWWSGLDVGVLDALIEPVEALKAPHDEFWVESTG